MSNYVQSTNFATKDALTSGDPLKIVKGTEINTEFVNIAVAVATKADLVSPVLITPVLGTPTSGTLTNCTGLPMTTGITGTLPVANGGTGVTSSTGTGSVVLNASPSMTAPILGTPASGNLANCTFPTLNQNTTGSAATVTTTVNSGATGTTQSFGDNTNAIATTAFVQLAFQKLHPVGSIYIAVISTNPGTLLGFGTWTAFGAGRVLVGFDAGNVLFDTAEETGGSANATLPSHTHTATVTDPGHFHTFPFDPNATTGTSGGTAWSAAVTNTSTAVTGITVANSTEGASATNANYQPYITVYMWKRTA